MRVWIDRNDLTCFDHVFELQSGIEVVTSLDFAGSLFLSSESDCSNIVWSIPGTSIPYDSCVWLELFHVSTIRKWQRQLPVYSILLRAGAFQLDRWCLHRTGGWSGSGRASDFGQDDPQIRLRLLKLIPAHREKTIKDITRGVTMVGSTL